MDKERIKQEILAIQLMLAQPTVRGEVRKALEARLRTLNNILRDMNKKKN